MPHSTINRLRLAPEQIALFRGAHVLVANRYGLFDSGMDGFFLEQTRFLSRYGLQHEGRPVRPVCANAVDPHAGIAYYLLTAPGGARGGPPGGGDRSGGEIVAKGIEIQVNSFAGGGFHQDVAITNRTLAPVTLALDWILDADFADLDEVSDGRRRQSAPVLRHWTALGEGAGELTFRYDHPRLNHATAVRFTGPGTVAAVGSAVRLTLTLAPQVPAAVDVDVCPVFLGQRFEPWFGRDGRPTAHHPAPDLAERWMADATALEAGDPLVQTAWDRAAADLCALHRLTGDDDEMLTPMAGIPKYTALFGRDTLVAGLQSTLLSPRTIGGALRAVGRWTARRYDDARDAQPGKVLHQHQLSPLALLGENPFYAYYGDYSAPALFILGAAAHFAQTGDRAAFAAVRDEVLATLDWMDRDGDIDGDGFYEFRTLAGRNGIKNQGWKDSGQAILYPDGAMVPDPIAVAEIQAIFYAAKQALAAALIASGEHGRGAVLLAQAADLKQRFNAAFWMPEERYIAFGLDPQKQQIRTIASDGASCLSYGILDADKACAVRDRLMQPDLFSGWGVRTLSSRHPAYNPLAYHLGTVWPVATANICFGLARHGFTDASHTLARAMFEASDLFDYNRLPEVFGGHPRDGRHPHPGIYPEACSPQAWSATAVLHIVHALTGMTALAPRDALLLRPALPPWLPRLTLRNLRLGERRLALTLHRRPDGGTEHEILAGGDGLRVIRPDPPPAGEDGLAHGFGLLAS